MKKKTAKKHAALLLVGVMTLSSANIVTAYEEVFPEGEYVYADREEELVVPEDPEYGVYPEGEYEYEAEDEAEYEEEDELYEIEGEIEIESLLSSAFSGGNGLTAQTPFILSTPQDIIDWGRVTSSGQPAAEFFNNAFYMLVTDVDMAFNPHFIPIGYGHPNGFTGQLVGNNFTIRNLLVNFDRDVQPLTTRDLEGIGLFAFTNHATIRNLTLENVEVVVRGITRDNVGTLVGYATNNTIIENVTVRGRVEAGIANRVGGLVGRASANVRITNVEVFVDVAGNNETGGLVGSIGTNTDIAHVYFSGNVRGNDNTGGIAGWIGNNTTIVSAYVSGTVTGQNNVGGIFGSYQNNDTRAIHINSNSVRADIVGNDQVGGIGGFTRNHVTGASPILRRITHNYTEGAIQGNNNIGGIVGYVQGEMGPWNNSSPLRTINTHITDNYSITFINGNTNVGGIVGFATRQFSISRNFTYQTIRVNGVGGGLLGSMTVNGNANALIENNLVIPHITAPSTATIGILFGTQSGTALTRRNNYYSLRSVIMGGVAGNFTQAQPASDFELHLPSWWDNVLLINTQGAFNTARVLDNLLPTVRRVAGGDVRFQRDVIFEATQMPEAEILVHVYGSGERGIMEVETFGSHIVRVNGLMPFTDYLIIGNQIHFQPAFLATLEVDRDHRFLVTFSGGQSINVFIRVIEVLPQPPVLIDGDRTERIFVDITFGAGAAFNTVSDPFVFEGIHENIIARNMTTGEGLPNGGAVFVIEDESRGTTGVWFMVTGVDIGRTFQNGGNIIELTFEGGAVQRIVVNLVR